MNRDESVSVLSILKTAYPAFYKDLKKDEAEKTIQLWAMMFENDSTKIVVESVKALICSCKFPPTIAEVKEKIALIKQPETMSEMEAWGEVRKAISYYDAKENFDRLPQTLQRLVGSPNQLREWSQMDSSVVQSVVQSNFMRSYTARVKSEKELSMLPESTKELIESLSGKMSLLGAGA